MLSWWLIALSGAGTVIGSGTSHDPATPTTDDSAARCVLPALGKERKATGNRASQGRVGRQIALCNFANAALTISTQWWNKLEYMFSLE